MNIKTIGHVGITVKNLETSIKFYRDILGFKLISEPGEILSGKEVEKGVAVPGSIHRTCMLEVCEGQLLEMMEFGEANPAIGAPIPLNTIGSHHIAYAVNDIQKWVERLTAEGIEFYSKPNQEKTRTGEILWVFFLDPDGIPVELIEER
jgi:catechol 2,3-dioxygenase-like lactoylglutathione lyase family enzyme